MKPQFKIILLVLFCSILFVNCAKDKMSDASTNIQSGGRRVVTANRDARATILGKHKENPFSVANMQRALDTLKTYATEEDGISLKSLQSIEITPTDLYVRFLPSDSIHYKQLVKDSTLTLFNFPLDYEIKQTGEYYKDSTVTGDFAWQYTTVKPGYVPPTGVKYEILSELFLIEHTENFTIEDLGDSAAISTKSAKIGTPISNKAIEALHAIAFTITGNAQELNRDDDDLLKAYNPNKTRYCFGKSWWKVCFTTSNPYYTPEGNVSLNTPTGTTGVRGVKVRIWNWFAFTDARTDAAGNFKSPSNFYSWSCWGYVDYHIILDGRHFSRGWTLSNTLFGALTFLTDYYNAGNHSADKFNITFDTNTEFWGRTVINNAMYDYIDNAASSGITLPPDNLDIASCMAHGNWTSSAPLLTKYINFSFTRAYLDTWLKYVLDPRIIVVADFVKDLITSAFGPDLILRYSKQLTDYNKIQHLVWHELTHASQLECMKNQKGYLWASDYWSENVFRQATQGAGTYGAIGDPSWQIIALSEGWANYRERVMSASLLNIVVNTYPATKFPEGYLRMYEELVTDGCSNANIEQSLATYSIVGFRNNLISRYPSLRAQITKTIQAYE